MTDTPLIFLVDDDADFLDLERRILMGGGYTTVCFSDPRKALSAMTAEGAGRPDLVVTDLMMVTMDSGFTLAKAVKSDPRCAGIPVIIITAVGSQKGFDFHPRAAEDLSAMSADAFFDKPVAPDVLLAKVRDRPLAGLVGFRPLVGLAALRPVRRHLGFRRRWGHRWIKLVSSWIGKPSIRRSYIKNL